MDKEMTHRRIAAVEQNVLRTNFKGELRERQHESASTAEHQKADAAAVPTFSTGPDSGQYVTVNGSEP
jgi:hypothetical protein